MNARITVAAHAKLNLVLAVGPLRPDGYHHLASVIQPVDLADDVTVEVGDGNAITVSAPGLEGGDTLATRAATKYLAAAGTRARVAVSIDKRIPVGAGLGGGSSDAAAVLRALDRLIGGVSQDVLTTIAADIGSDVPSLLHPCATVVRGRGEVVEPVESVMPERRFLLAWPGVSLATAAVYAAYEPRREVLPASAAIVECARNGTFYNDLAGTALALCGPMRASEQMMREAGLATLVAGSGSSVAAPVDDVDDIGALRARLEASGCVTWMCLAR